MKPRSRGPCASTAPIRDAARDRPGLLGDPTTPRCSRKVSRRSVSWPRASRCAAMPSGDPTRHERDAHEHVLAEARGFFHPVGTCAIGPLSTPPGTSSATRISSLQTRRSCRRSRPRTRTSPPLRSPSASQSSCEGSSLAGHTFGRVLKTAALLAVLVVTTGCGSIERAAGPDPGGRKAVERHLVYEKLIGERGVWIADVDGGHAQLLVRGGRAPVISPDGKWVVYVSCDPEDELACKGTFVISTSGGKTAKTLVQPPHTPPEGGHLVPRFQTDCRLSWQPKR